MTPCRGHDTRAIVAVAGVVTPDYREQNGGTRVMTRTTVAGVPNQPKTPQRTFRCADDLWLAFKATAEAEGTTASEILRTLIEDYLFHSGMHPDDPRPSTRG